MAATFTIATANIQNTPDLPRRDVRRAAERVGNVAHLVGFQEIREGEDVTDVRQGLGHGWALAKAGTSTPIGVKDRKFKVVESDSVLFHHAYGRIPTPKRQASLAVVEHRGHPFMPQLAIFNAHFINGAFNKRHLDTRRERRQLWLASWYEYKRAVEIQYALGRTVVLIGDFNRANLPNVHPHVRWVYDHGIDKIGVITQPAWHFHVKSRWKQDNASDHDALFVKGTLRKR